MRNACEVKKLKKGNATPVPNVAKTGQIHGSISCFTWLLKTLLLSVVTNWNVLAKDVSTLAN